MYKNICIAALIISTCTLRAKPPLLPWASNSCWSNSAIQLLRNIKPLTEELLGNHKSTYKKNDFMERYIALLEGIHAGKNGTELKNLTENMRSLCYKQVTGKEGTEFEDPFSFVSNFILNLTILNFPQEKFLSDILAGHTSPFSVTDDSDSLSKLPLYLIMLMHNTVTNIMDSPPKNKAYTIPILVDKTQLKYSPQGLKESPTYELIGMVVHEPSRSHYTAYIKDQFEPEQRWYYCDDLGRKVELLSPQQLKTFNTFSDTENANFPRFLLYKKIDNDASVEQLAQALADIAKTR